MASWPSGPLATQEALSLAKQKSMGVLSKTQSAVAEIEAAIARKPRPYGFEDAPRLKTEDPGATY